MSGKETPERLHVLKSPAARVRLWQSPSVLSYRRLQCSRHRKCPLVAACPQSGQHLFKAGDIARGRPYYIHSFHRTFAESLISYNTLRIQTAPAAKGPAMILFFLLDIPGKVRSNGAKIKGTHRNGFHGIDKLLAVDFGVAVTVT